MNLSQEIKKQDLIDKFYADNGPCCAGCDWWRWHNTVIGECTRSSPVSERDRIGMLGMENLTLSLGSGFPFTRRSDICGEFEDD